MLTAQSVCSIVLNFIKPNFINLDALTDLLQTIRQPTNASKLQDALGVAGNDMLKRMQYVFPILTQIEMEVIVRHGFSGSCDGI